MPYLFNASHTPQNLFPSFHSTLNFDLLPNIVTFYDCIQLFPVLNTTLSNSLCISNPDYMQLAFFKLFSNCIHLGSLVKKMLDSKKEADIFQSKTQQNNVSSEWNYKNMKMQISNCDVSRKSYSSSFVY